MEPHSAALDEVDASSTNSAAVCTWLTVENQGGLLYRRSSCHAKSFLHLSPATTLGASDCFLVPLERAVLCSVEDECAHGTPVIPRTGGCRPLSVAMAEHTTREHSLLPCPAIRSGHVG
jgi:hypothetical protein